MLRDKDRAADAVGLDVVPVGHARRCSAVLQSMVVGPGIGVEFFVPVIPCSRTMKFLSSALGDHRDGATGSVPEFSLVIRCQHLQFLDRVEVRLHLKRGVGTRIHIGDAVHREIQRGETAVNIHAADGAVAGHVAVGGVDHARNKLHVTEQIPALQRQRVQILRIHRLSFFRARELHLRGFRGDRDGFSHGAQLENHLAGVVCFLRGHDDAGLRFALETGGFHGDVVGTWFEIGKAISTQTVGDAQAHRSRVRACQRYGSRSNHLTLRIHHRTRHRTTDGLPEQTGATKRQCENDARNLFQRIFP